MSAFLEIDEPLDVLIDTLRELEKLRKLRIWTRDTFNLDLALAPQTFHALLDISAINFVESTDRNLEVQVVSLKETRQPDDPVTVGNLNIVMRELYRALEGAAEIKRAELKSLLFGKDIAADRVALAEDLLARWKHAREQRILFFPLPWKTRAVENELQAAFPQARVPRPLDPAFGQAMAEIDFYRHCLKLNDKWKALNLNMFELIRDEALSGALENVQEMGSLLWSVVYKYPTISGISELAGIRMDDIATLFADPKQSEA